MFNTGLQWNISCNLYLPLTLKEKRPGLSFAALLRRYLGRNLFVKGALCSWCAAENTGALAGQPEPDILRNNK